MSIATACGSRLVSASSTSALASATCERRFAPRVASPLTRMPASSSETAWVSMSAGLRCLTLPRLGTVGTRTLKRVRSACPS
eukprot:2652565-Alexandrium_andersonii.AAC.1